MLDRILFNPDNRLLGSSTGDLSLYGGQTDSSVILREARPDDLSAPREPFDSASPGVISAYSAESQLGQVSSASGVTMEPVASLLAAAPAMFLQPTAPTRDGGTHDAGQSGVTTPAPAAPSGFNPGSGAPPSAASNAPATPSKDIDAAIDGAPHASGLNDVLDGSALSGLDSLAGGTVDGVGALTDETLKSVGTLVSSTLSGVSAVTAPVLDGVSGAVEPALDATTTTLDGLTDAVAPITGPLSPIVDTAGDTLSATVGAVGSTAAGLVEGTADTLDGVAGNDPEGGVATLVSLVSVSDMFDLHPVDAPAAEIGSDPGFAVLDALAADLPDTLLGTDQHDDAGSGVSDHFDHSFGL